MSPSFFPAASLYAAVEHSPVGTLFFNQSFEITYANPAAAALPDGPSVGMDIRDLTGPLDPEENGREPRVLRRGKRSFPYRLTRIQDSG